MLNLPKQLKNITISSENIDGVNATLFKETVKHMLSITARIVIPKPSINLRVIKTLITNMISYLQVLLFYPLKSLE